MRPWARALGRRIAKAFPGRLSRRDVVSVALLGGFAFVGLFLILQGLHDGVGFDARIIVGLVVVLIVPAAAAYRFSRAARPEGQGSALAPAAPDRDPLAEAIESMHEGVALFDSDDRLVLCNRLYRELFAEAGAPVASGTRFEDMLRAFVSRGRVADLGKDPESWIVRRLEEHRSPADPVKIYLADGRCLQIGECATGDGGIVSIQTDITEIERNEAARRAREETTRAIIDTVFDGLVTFDSHGNIESFNRAAQDIFGYAAEEARGENVTQLLAPPFDTEYREAIAAGFAPGDGGDLGAIREITRRRKDGSEFPLEIALSEFGGNWPLPERRRAQRQLFLGTVRDVSTQKELTHQLQQAQKMEAIGTLAGGSAHDFNNILSIILGYSSLALEGSAREGEGRENLEMVVQAGRRARDLVDQILTFSRRGEHTKSALDLGMVLTEVLKLMRSTLPATIEIRQSLADAPAQAMADGSPIHQVLMNLCTNAGQAMEDDGGTLAVDLDRLDLDAAHAARRGGIAAGAYHRLTVTDTGYGMDRATAERVFEPFFTTKGIGSGTGLGLSVAHGIVTEHGGAISVQSAAGSGTTFEVLLPVHYGAAAEPAPERADAPTGKGRILFVDDESALVRMADKVLSKLGYTVLGETDSTAALARFREDPQAIDLVITDQTMPGLTGDALTAELRKIAPTFRSSSAPATAAATRPRWPRRWGWRAISRSRSCPTS